MTTMNRSLLLLPLMVAAIASPALAQISLSLGNAGFESAISPGITGTSGIWQGDLNSVTTTQNSITPFAGSQMLRFDHMAPDGTSFGTGADALQLVDLSAYSSSIAAGGFTLTLSAYYNRSDSTYSKFENIIRSYSGSIANFPTDLNSSTATQFADLVSDSVVSSWEQLSVSLTLPTNTTYVAIWVTALSDNQNISNFPVGYHADNVTLTAIPEPSTSAAIVGAFGLGLALWRRRRTARTHF